MKQETKEKTKLDLLYEGVMNLIDELEINEDTHNVFLVATDETMEKNENEESQFISCVIGSAMGLAATIDYAISKGENRIIGLLLKQSL